MTTRRNVLKGGLAAAALTSAPSIIRTQAQPLAARTVKAVMHADLRVLDPIWTTANITAYHGAMIYDTLFGLDASFAPQPQMVSRWGLSEDKLTYTFELRDGLKFSDGAAVTAEPSENFSPSRSSNVWVSLSSETPNLPTICGRVRWSASSANSVS